MYQIKKFVTSFFKVYPNRHLYLHTFLRKTPWKLYDPFMTFRLQMWRMNYLHISKSFSVCLWNIFENITGMPLRGHLLAARNSYRSLNNSRLTVYLKPQRGIWKWHIKIIAHFVVFLFSSLAVIFLVGLILLSHSQW